MEWTDKIECEQHTASTKMIMNRRMHMGAQENKAVVERLFEIVNKGDAEGYREVLAEHYVFHGPGGIEANGIDAIIEFASAFFTAFPDLTTTVEEIIAEADKVVARFRISGTHQGEFDGIAATGRTVRFTAISMMRIDGGKVVEEWENFDELGLMQQIGALPAMGGDIE